MGEEIVVVGGVGGVKSRETRVRGGEENYVIGQALRCLPLLRASELFVGENGVVHDVCCLQRGDEASFRGGHQLERGKQREAGCMETRCRWSNGDQSKSGAALVKMKRVEKGGSRRARGGEASERAVRHVHKGGSPE